MRGEHWAGELDKNNDPGSSPHARGTLITLSVDILFVGIIPACAGNTSPVSSLGIGDGDHPRMRGEHLVLAGRSL